MTSIPADALHETWESVYDKSVELARMIEAHCEATGDQFDSIVLVPRGSYYPVNIIARELGFGAPDLLHASVTSYEAGTTNRKVAFELGQMPEPKHVVGKHLLIIDEVCETGYTLDFLTKWLTEHGAAEVKVAVLHYKPSRSQTNFKPDWFVAQTDRWIVYPWEINEKPNHSSKVKRSVKR